MIEVRKGQDRIPCDPNANLATLVQTHGSDSVLVDGVSVAEIADRAAIEAAAEAEAALTVEDEATDPAEDAVALEVAPGADDPAPVAPE